MTLELVAKASFELLERRRHLGPRALEQLGRSVSLAPRRRPSEAQSKLVARLQRHVESASGKGCTEGRLDRVGECATAYIALEGSRVGRWPSVLVEWSPSVGAKALSEDEGTEAGVDRAVTVEEAELSESSWLGV